MHIHRLVPEGADEYDGRSCGYDVGINKKDEWIREERFHYNKFDTIPMPSEWSAAELVVLAGITKEEFTEIAHWYVWNKTYEKDGNFIEEDFGAILSDLISLAISGLTVEEIKKLSEVKK